MPYNINSPLIPTQKPNFISDPCIEHPRTTRSDLGVYQRPRNFATSHVTPTICDVSDRTQPFDPTVARYHDLRAGPRNLGGNSEASDTLRRAITGL